MDEIYGSASVRQSSHETHNKPYNTYSGAPRRQALEKNRRCQIKGRGELDTASSYIFTKHASYAGIEVALCSTAMERVLSCTEKVGR